MDGAPHHGRTAIVTGAGSGIGRATALRLASEGATVVACDVDGAGLASLVAAAPGLSLSAVEADVSEQADVDRIARTAGDAVDLLANVAGVFDSFLPITEMDDAVWERLLAVNLTGPMRLTRAVLPAMLAGGRGDIVNVASIASLAGGTGGAAYTSSKHGVLGLTRHVAALYADQGIRCNAVCPAGVSTNLGANATAGPRAPWVMERLGRVSLPRAARSADPDEVASLISYLCTADSVNINGAAIPTDGGWHSL